MSRITRFLLLLTVLSVTAVAAGACSGSSSSAPGSPTPTASPFVPVGCELIWVNKTSNPILVDYYIVDGPVSIWQAGTTTASFFIGDPTGLTNVTGACVRGFSLLDGSRAAAIIATSGSFQVTLPLTSALAIGGPIAFQDSVAQHYFLINTAGNLSTDQGASGTGSFTGTWSNPDDPNVAPGTGTVGILFNGSALTLGKDYSYARCYQTRPKPAKALLAPFGVPPEGR